MKGLTEGVNLVLVLAHEVIDTGFCNPEMTMWTKRDNMWWHAMSKRSNSTRGCYKLQWKVLLRKLPTSSSRLFTLQVVTGSSDVSDIIESVESEQLVFEFSFRGTRKGHMNDDSFVIMIMKTHNCRKDVSWWREHSAWNSHQQYMIIYEWIMAKHL
jgi:hypothetical protein